MVLPELVDQSNGIISMNGDSFIHRPSLQIYSEAAFSHFVIISY